MSLHGAHVDDAGVVPGLEAAWFVEAAVDGYLVLLDGWVIV